MIFVDRSAIAPPKDLVDVGGVGDKELAKARTTFQATGPGTQSVSVKFNFAAYKSESVRTALKALFGTKCAYCESTYAETHPMEVEHWRPKNAIVENGKLTFPGYWWLAAAWDNLLPSCIDCNRERSHLINGRSTKAGKACKFPVSGARLLPTGGNIESPLLLNPCLDQPDDFLEFRSDGTVIPRTGSANPSRAAASIDVYGLIRPGLVQARGAFAKGLLADMAIAASCLAALAQDQNCASKRSLARMALAKLHAATAPSEKYAGMARQLVAKFRVDPTRFLDKVTAGQV